MQTRVEVHPALGRVESSADTSLGGPPMQKEEMPMPQRLLSLVATDGPEAQAEPHEGVKVYAAFSKAGEQVQAAEQRTANAANVPDAEVVYQRRVGMESGQRSQVPSPVRYHRRLNDESL